MLNDWRGRQKEQRRRQRRLRGSESVDGGLCHRCVVCAICVCRDALCVRLRADDGSVCECRDCGTGGCGCAASYPGFAFCRARLCHCDARGLCSCSAFCFVHRHSRARSSSTPVPPAATCVALNAASHYYMEIVGPHPIESRAQSLEQETGQVVCCDIVKQASNVHCKQCETRSVSVYSVTQRRE